jgi:hypothetical protein
MNLLQLRQKFRTISGRFDLVNDDGSDNGADFYINEGRKYLDRLDETQKSTASHFSLIEPGFGHTTFPFCRAIREVWLADINGRWKLEKKKLSDLISGYLTSLPSLRTNGTPLYYATAISRYVPEDATADTMEAIIGWMDVPSGNAHEYNAILLSAPVQYQTTAIINGLFYSKELTNDTDENYWSVAHPMLLICAAMRSVEVTQRNTQGVNDWDLAISKEITQLGFDFVEEIVAEVDQMDG